MKEGHFASKCTSTSCRKCSKKHNTLVHMEKVKQAASVTISEGSQRFSTDNPVTLSVQHQEGYQQRKRSYVLLSTARINILDNHGVLVECRALLDSGSQLNFITDRLYKWLGFKGIPDLVNGKWHWGNSTSHTTKT